MARHELKDVWIRRAGYGCCLLGLAVIAGLACSPPWESTIEGAPLPGTEQLDGDVGWFAMSPDGQSILLWLRPAAQRQDRGFFLYDVAGEDVRPVSWSDEARRFVGQETHWIGSLQDMRWTGSGDAVYIYAGFRHGDRRRSTASLNFSSMDGSDHKGHWLRLDPSDNPPLIRIAQGHQTASLPGPPVAIDPGVRIEGEGTREVTLLDGDRDGSPLARFRFLSASSLAIDAAKISPDRNQVAIILGGLGSMVATSWGPRAFLIHRKTGRITRLRVDKLVQARFGDRYFPPLYFHASRRLIYALGDTDRHRVYQWAY